MAAPIGPAARREPGKHVESKVRLEFAGKFEDVVNCHGELRELDRLHLRLRSNSAVSATRALLVVTTGANMGVYRMDQLIGTLETVRQIAVRHQLVDA